MAHPEVRERVHDGVLHGGRGTDRRRFPDALRAERVERRRRLGVRDAPRRQFRRRGERVRREVPGERRAELVVADLLVERLRDALAEAAVDLMRLAGLQPAGVICEIQNVDGSMARLPQLMQNVKLGGLGGVVIRGGRAPAPLSPEEQAQLTQARGNYAVLRAQSSAEAKTQVEKLDSLQIRGVTKEWLQLPDTNVEQGRAILPSEFENRRPVTVLGYGAADRLFGALDPIDKIVQFNGIPFRVVGVAEKQGSIFGQSQDEWAVIPLGVYQRMFGDHRPARTTIQAAALPGKGLRVEIDCIAYRP